MSSRCRRRLVGLALTLAAVVAPAGARQRVMRAERSLAGFSRRILALQDSAHADTVSTADRAGAAHRVFADSGRVWYQPQRGERWLAPVRLSLPGQECSSPLVFELAPDGREPLLAALWRVESESGPDVFCRVHRPGAHPLDWSMALCMTLR